jgi:hypothetical protein
MIIPSSAILHGCFGRLGDASIDPDFHSSKWTLVRNNKMKGDKDRKKSKFDFGTHSFKTVPGTVNFVVASEGYNLTYPMKNENVAFASDLQQYAEKNARKPKQIKQLSKKAFEKVLSNIKLQDEKLAVINRSIDKAIEEELAQEIKVNKLQ